MTTRVFGKLSGIIMPENGNCHSGMKKPGNLPGFFMRYVLYNQTTSVFK